jgi:uncharacterized membrane protein YtjA (UPF0391 family)
MPPAHVPAAFSCSWQARNTRRFPRATQREEGSMLYWTLIFVVVALVAGVLGFGGIASTASGAARMLFAVFVILLVVSMVAGRGWLH